MGLHLSSILIVMIAMIGAPSFEWKIEGGRTTLYIDFGDGDDPDAAVMYPAVFENETIVDPCILSGHLKRESDVMVAVNGCPNGDTFQV